MNWCVFCYEFLMKDLELLCNSTDFDKIDNEVITKRFQNMKTRREQL
jgi:hypothetical protein